MPNTDVVAARPVGSGYPKLWFKRRESGREWRTHVHAND